MPLALFCDKVLFCDKALTGETPHFTVFSLCIYLISVGKPIDVEKVAEPSQEDIDTLHDKYVKALVDLFEENKTKYGLDESVHLNFIG